MFTVHSGVLKYQSDLQLLNINNYSITPTDRCIGGLDPMPLTTPALLIATTGGHGKDYGGKVQEFS